MSPRKEIYGAIDINVAVTRKELSNDTELQATIIKHYLHRNWKLIKENSYENRKGYNPDYIQDMIYKEMKVVIDTKLIKTLIKEVRYRVKKYKDRKRRKREKKYGKKKKESENNKSKVTYID